MKSPITQWWRPSVVHRAKRGIFCRWETKSSPSICRIAQIANSRNTAASVRMPTETSGRDFGRFRKRG